MNRLPWICRTCTATLSAFVVTLALADIPITTLGKDVFLVADGLTVFAVWEEGGSVLFDRSDDGASQAIG